MSARDQAIKCVVWDLDHTLWDGVLMEGDNVCLKSWVEPVLAELDARGILHSIASRNEEELAITKLREFGLDDYFLYPQINWNSKASAIQEISVRLNIGLDTFAFVDDQDFERDEVAHLLPQVLCLDACQVPSMPAMPRMNPRFITGDSRMRRRMYQSDARRNEAEKQFVGSNEEFLKTLNLRFTISRATEEDLQRAEELTVRTHQLNTTGYTYSFDELNAFRSSPRHLLFIGGLEDRYGVYGKIGLCLVEQGREAWTIKLLLTSCRVISRGVGSVMLNYVMGLAREAGVRLRAEFIPNGRNRMMYITYKFAGFCEIRKQENLSLLESDLTLTQAFPGYLEVIVP